MFPCIYVSCVALCAGWYFDYFYFVCFWNECQALCVKWMKLFPNKCQRQIEWKSVYVYLCSLWAWHVGVWKWISPKLSSCIQILGGKSLEKIVTINKTNHFEFSSRGEQLGQIEWPNFAPCGHCAFHIFHFDSGLSLWGKKIFGTGWSCILQESMIHFPLFSLFQHLS